MQTQANQLVLLHGIQTHFEVVAEVYQTLVVGPMIRRRQRDPVGNVVSATFSSNRQDMSRIHNDSTLYCSPLCSSICQRVLATVSTTKPTGYMKESHRSRKVVRKLVA